MTVEVIETWLKELDRKNASTESIAFETVEAVGAVFRESGKSTSITRILLGPSCGAKAAVTGLGPNRHAARDTITDKKLVFAAPPVIDAARARENWFPGSLILLPCCPTGTRLSTGKCCRFLGGLGAARGRRRVVAPEDRLRG